MEFFSMDFKICLLLFTAFNIDIAVKSHAQLCLCSDEQNAHFTPALLSE